MITELINALHAGEELKNKETWKNAQVTANSVAALLSCGVACCSLVGVHLPVDREQVLAIAGGIAAVLGVYNSITTVATSASIGLQPKSSPPDEPGLHGSS